MMLVIEAIQQLMTMVMSMVEIIIVIDVTLTPIFPVDFFNSWPLLSYYIIITV